MSAENGLEDLLVAVKRLIMPFAVFFYWYCVYNGGLIEKSWGFNCKYALLEPEVKKFGNIRKKVQGIRVIDIWCNERENK